MSPTTAKPEQAEGSASAPPRMSYEEFLDWLDEDKHAEWIDGEVIMHSPVSRRHSDICGFLLSILRVYVVERQLGEVHTEPFLMRTSSDLPARMPDILFVARENLSRLQANLLDGPADLAVEVISPESRSRDRGEKFYEYEQGGVREYWLIDPDRRQAEFYQRDAEGIFRPVLPDDSGIYRSLVLTGLYLRVEWLWQRPLPSPLSVLREWGLTG